MDVKNIQAEWDKRRCEPTIMFSAFLYKPSTDPRSSSTFASDNFSFCVRSLIDDVFKELLAPVLGVFSQQMAAANTTNGILNSVRNQVGNTFRSFGGVFNEFFDTYKRGTMQLSRITQLLKQAMLKVSAAVVSIVFLGLSLMTSLLNSYDFVVKVVIIIMSILVALIVLLFFALIPFMPIIFTTIAILSAAGLGSAVGGMAGAFCIDPDELVLLANGDKIPISEIPLGAELGEGCGKVEGILETDPVQILYNVEGVKMTGSHLVFFGPAQTPLFASEYPGAVTVPNTKMTKLIVLNTTSHKIPLVREDGGTLLVGDWEEIQTEEGQETWEKLVWEILNGSSSVYSETSTSTEALFAPSTMVVEKQLGVIPISSVKRGMIISDMNGFPTKVLGTYKATPQTPFATMTSGVRFYSSEGVWKKIGIQVKGNETIGYSLITESGHFRIITDSGHMYSVRDFTEVGESNLELTYKSTQHGLEKK